MVIGDNTPTTLPDVRDTEQGRTDGDVGYDKAMSGHTAGFRNTDSMEETEGEKEDRDTDSSSVLYEISEKIFVVLSLLVTVSGLVGNVITFIVTKRCASLRQSPVYIFMIALTVADSMVLLLDFLNNWIEYVFKHNLLDENEWFCKGHRFLFDVCYTYAAWLVVGISVERCIAVCFPLQAKRFCTIRSSQTFVIVSPLIISVVYFHNFWGWVKRGGRCDIHDDFQLFHREYGPWISATIYSWIPTSILIVSNGAIVWKLSRNQDNRKSMGVDKTDTLRVTVTVIVVCVAFTMLTVPVTLFYIVVFAKQMFGRLSPSMSMGKTIVVILSLSNHAINFWIYFLGLTRFKAEVLCLLRLKDAVRGEDEQSISSQNTRSSSGGESDFKASCGSLATTSVTQATETSL